MSTADWRRFARQPSGIMTLLLLVLLLALRVHACPMPTDADPAPAHGCCHDTALDLPASSALSSCHDGPCLQAFSDQGGLNASLSTSEPDRPAPASVAEWPLPDGSGRHDFPPHPILAVGSAPSQRSLVLRL